MADSTQQSVKLAALATAAIFTLLLVAPWVPPNVALFGAVALFLLWGVVYFGGREIYRIITGEIEARREAKRPDEGTTEYVRQQYADGEITEQEMEERIDDILSSEEDVATSDHERTRETDTN